MKEYYSESENRMDKPLKKERESGVELLRIILMLQVIFLHISNFGQLTEMTSNLGGGYEMTHWIFWLINRCPVFVFLIISGYFSVTSSVKLNQIGKKAIKVYLPMIFYSVMIFLFFGLIFSVTVKENSPLFTPIEYIKNVIEPLYTSGIKNTAAKSFLPVTSRIWYFMTDYLIVLILSPAINIVLNKLSKKEYLILLGILFFLLSIWPMLASYDLTKNVISTDSIVETTKGRGLYTFIFMYIIGGYLRLHFKKSEKADWKYLLLFFLCVAVDFALIYTVPGYNKVVRRNDNPVAIIEDICLFMFFNSLKFRSKFINRVSSHNLGVYMIHEDFIMRKVLWGVIFTAQKSAEFYENPLYILCIFGIVSAIYIPCICIDVIREKIFDGISFVIAKIKSETKKTAD